MAVQWHHQHRPGVTLICLSKGHLEFVLGDLYIGSRTYRSTSRLVSSRLQYCLLDDLMDCHYR